MPRDDEAVDRGCRAVSCERLGWSHRDAVGFIVGLGLPSIAILVNVLLLQSGPHPAPMFKPAPCAAASPATGSATPQSDVGVPRTRAARRQPPSRRRPPLGPPRPAAEIVADIQRELARRGFYDGVVDGRYGPKTDAAIRDFEQAAGLKPSAEPNEALLRCDQRSNAAGLRSAPSAARRACPHDPIAACRRSRPDAEVLSPSKRVAAVQRALAEFGYGQIKPTGVVDSDTQAAIEKFERDRRLPVTGQVSDRVTRELSSVTGRPLD